MDKNKIEPKVSFTFQPDSVDVSPLLRGDVECIANHNRDSVPLATGI